MSSECYPDVLSCIQRVTPVEDASPQIIVIKQIRVLQFFGTAIAAVVASISLKERFGMQHFLLWPTLTILAGASATIPVVQNSNTRNLLYWLVLSPMAVGLLSVFCMGIR